MVSAAHGAGVSRYRRGMKLQMIAITLVAAIGGGIVGVALWRTLDRDVKVAPAATSGSSSNEAGQGWWYCSKFGDELTSCERSVDDCQRLMAKSDLPCVVLPVAWCGRLHCTATRAYCEKISPDNGTCELRRPSGAVERQPTRATATDWWCHDRGCQRHKEACEDGGRTCRQERIAFCFHVGAPTMQCFPHFTGCTLAAPTAEDGVRCVGVE